MNFDPLQPATITIDRVALCASYSRTVELWAALLLGCSLLAIAWFGRREWISRYIKNPSVKTAIGTMILTMIGILAALLQANLSR